MQNSFLLFFSFLFCCHWIVFQIVVYLCRMSCSRWNGDRLKWNSVSELLLLFHSIRWMFDLFLPEWRENQNFVCVCVHLVACRWLFSLSDALFLINLVLFGFRLLENCDRFSILERQSTTYLLIIVNHEKTILNVAIANGENWIHEEWGRRQCGTRMSLIRYFSALTLFGWLQSPVYLVSETNANANLMKNSAHEE